MSDFKNSFSENDDSTAYESFRQWQGKVSETVDDYTLRRRKAELYALVRKVIRDELTPEQQEIVRLHWYEGKNLTDVAAEMNVDRSRISRKVKKINEIIYGKVKYAMEYRYGKNFSDETTVIIKTNHVACCPIDGESIGKRLRQLRLINSLSETDIEDITGISKKRLITLETCGEKITAEELKKLVKLFSTTSDYIIFGKILNVKGA